MHNEQNYVSLSKIDLIINFGCTCTCAQPNPTQPGSVQAGGCMCVVEAQT